MKLNGEYCARGEAMNGQNRKDSKRGSGVYIVLKKDQRSGKRTKGIVKDLLTKSSFHPHGIKVRLEDGQVGRVQEIIK
ncbi:MAG: YwbE family protein [Methanobacterium paludis]|nr:YwbE family protein [Methanobacterium paludis]